jgi:hypothetical protein
LEFGSVALGSSKTLNVTCTANILITKLSSLTLGKAVFQVSNSSWPTGTIKAGASFTFPVTFNLSSSLAVQPGVQTTSISIGTTNGVAKWATSMPVTFTGTSISAAPYVTMNPLEIDFMGIVIGSETAALGSDSTFVLSNVGQSPMTILGLAYMTGTINGDDVAYHHLTSTTTVNGTTTWFDANAHFSSQSMPTVGTVIPGGKSITIDANFVTTVR